MGDHAVVKLRDAVAARAAEGERQQRVEKTGKATDEHPTTESGRHCQMLQVGFPHRLRMLSEKSPQSHGHSLGKAA